MIFEFTNSFQKTAPDHRRKWDREEYERLAAERLEAEQMSQLEKNLKEPPIKRALLQPRDYRVRNLFENFIYFFFLYSLIYINLACSMF